MTLNPAPALGAWPAPAAHAVPGTHVATAPANDRGTPARPAAWRPTYLALLTWAFTLFSSARLVSYLPTLWAICASGDSSQHSLWTWGIWLGSNLTMALWLHEQHGQRWTRAALVNVVTAAMCAATFTVILVFRF